MARRLIALFGFGLLLMSVGVAVEYFLDQGQMKHLVESQTWGSVLDDRVVIMWLPSSWFWQVVKGWMVSYGVIAFPALLLSGGALFTRRERWRSAALSVCRLELVVFGVLVGVSLAAKVADYLYAFSFRPEILRGPMGNPMDILTLTPGAYHYFTSQYGWQDLLWQRFGLFNPGPPWVISAVALVALVMIAFFIDSRMNKAATSCPSRKPHLPLCDGL